MTKWDWKEKFERSKKKLGQLWESSFQGLNPNPNENMAVDFGTANTRINLPGKGIVINEPTVIALKPNTGEVVALGQDAREMAGREPRSINVVHPIKNGVIADCEAARHFISQLISRASTHKGAVNLGLLICVPADITPLEQKTYEDTILHAGASKVMLIEEPYAAAAGANLNLLDTKACMVIDIGAGTTDIAVISNGNVLHASTRRVGGGDIDRAISRYLHNERILEISDETAEEIKIKLGSVEEHLDQRALAVRGRNLETALPEEISVTNEEIRPLIQPVLRVIQQQVRAALEDIPTEASVDLLDSGIMLSGGSSQLPGIADSLSQELGLRVRVAENPALAAALGAGRLLEQQSDTSIGAIKIHKSPDPAEDEASLAEL